MKIVELNVRVQQIETRLSKVELKDCGVDSRDVKCMRESNSLVNYEGIRTELFHIELEYVEYE